jgi:hypothetical protein
MLPRFRATSVALSIVLAAPAAETLSAQQAATGDLVAAGLGIGYLTLSVGAVVRLAGHAREAKVGDRVRGRQPSLTGTVTAIDPDSVTIRSDSGEIRLARGEAPALRVNEARERKWAQGWAIGLLTGASLGALMGAATEAPAEDPSCDFICPNRGQMAAIAGVAMGVSGSVLGALIGAATHGERWSRISGFAERASVQVAPRSRALGVGARVRF